MLPFFLLELSTTPSPIAKSKRCYHSIKPLFRCLCTAIAALKRYQVCSPSSKVYPTPETSPAVVTNARIRHTRNLVLSFQPTPYRDHDHASIHHNLCHPIDRPPSHPTWLRQIQQRCGLYTRDSTTTHSRFTARSITRARPSAIYTTIRENNAAGLDPDGPPKGNLCSEFTAERGYFARGQINGRSICWIGRG